MIARCMVVLVTIALLGESALACRVVLKGTCGQDGVSLPRDGAIDVPTNARVWRLYRDTPPSGRPLVGLEPHTTVDLPGYHVSFTTGDRPDLAPPAQPRIGVVSIAVANGSGLARMDVASMSVSGQFSADTAVLRIRFFDAGHVTTYYMPANEYLVDEPGFGLHAGTILGEITAIDLAGNESPPAPFVAMSTHVSELESSCSAPDDQAHGSDLMESASVYGPLALDLTVILAVVIAMRRRSRKRANASVEPLTITAAEQLARGKRRLAALITIGLVAAVAGTVPLDVDGLTSVAASSPLLLALFWALPASWWTATRFLRLAAEDGAVACVRHDLVEVVLADRRVSLHCSPRLIAHARRNGLPKATSR